MRELLRGYSAPPGRFNEVRDPSGNLRQSAENLHTQLDDLIDLARAFPGAG